jgi:hypothetical protein
MHCGSFYIEIGAPPFLHARKRPFQQADVGDSIEDYGLAGNGTAGDGITCDDITYDVRKGGGCVENRRVHGACRYKVNGPAF